MNNISDLHIQKEILPLFDHTLNNFSKGILAGMLKEPLASKDAIILRQDTLKGFIKNHATLKNYSYPKINLLEVYNFIEKKSIIASAEKGNEFWSRISKKEREQERSKYIQFILLFHKLQKSFFEKIDITCFPESYKNEFLYMDNFLSTFKLNYYEELLRLQKLKNKQIDELIQLVSEKINNGGFKEFWDHYFLFEAHLALSIGISNNNFSFPVLSEESFSLHDFYHPLLKDPVKNNFTTENNVFLLTGANMSGKSTFLKSISLCVYLGHLGLGVPAAKAEIPFFNYISVSIDLQDDILNGYSHFMTEVMNLKNMVIEAQKQIKCFVVFDELFRGTNIEDALEISSTTLKGLTKFTNSVFFISTHLHQLKDLEEIKSGKITTGFIDCNITDNIPVFTYQLKEGWSDLKVGRLLFEKEGLNKMLS